MKTIDVLLAAAIALLVISVHDHVKTPSAADLLRSLHKHVTCRNITVFIDETDEVITVDVSCKEEAVQKYLQEVKNDSSFKIKSHQGGL